MTFVKLDRRTVLRSFLTLPLLAASGMPARAAATPQSAEGPFYPRPDMRFRDADNDLVKIQSKVQNAGGEIVALTGRVLDLNGTPVSGARVEIWQCDANGRYLHTGDRRRILRDPGFQGFGHVVTDESGAYAFRTIKPVPYPGRTPHIHVKVFAGTTELTTQFYIAGHPQNSRDSLYRRLSQSERRAVEMNFQNRGSVPTARVDIIL
ncbi:protocatechuate 3,4-dioxygenase [Hoeflea sp. TYP-13]|uniref:dioxygenase family protein n=1 Tax=Hoeflea sp. TYP-13 TaxID=3230023 RepID=UPI0034C5DC0B